MDQPIDEYERRAADCARLAKKAPTLELRKQYEELSKVWTDLARMRRARGADGDGTRTDEED